MWTSNLPHEMFGRDGQRNLDLASHSMLVIYD